MAKSSAERVKEYRDRQKQAQKSNLLSPAQAPSYLKTPFHEFMDGRHMDLEENLDAYGARLLGTDLGEAVQEFETEFEWEKPLTSLDRARGLMAVFLDAAKELATLINQYKLEEIERAIEEAIKMSADLPRGDVEALKKSFAEIDRLKAIRSDLRKPTRHTLVGIGARE